MTKEQIALAEQLLKALQDDTVAQQDAELFGDWIVHLRDHLDEIHLETARQLTGINS